MACACGFMLIFFVTLARCLFLLSFCSLSIRNREKKKKEWMDNIVSPSLSLSFALLPQLSLVLRHDERESEKKLY